MTTTLTLTPTDALSIMSRNTSPLVDTYQGNTYPYLTIAQVKDGAALTLVLYPDGTWKPLLEVTL